MNKTCLTCSKWIVAECQHVRCSVNKREALRSDLPYLAACQAYQYSTDALNPLWEPNVSDAVIQDGGGLICGEKQVNTL